MKMEERGQEGEKRGRAGEDRGQHSYCPKDGMGIALRHRIVIKHNFFEKVGAKARSWPFF